jgi:hypothetical protein
MHRDLVTLLHFDLSVGRGFVGNVFFQDIRFGSTDIRHSSSHNTTALVYQSHKERSTGFSIRPHFSSDTLPHK